MQRADCKFGIGGIDQQRELDLRGGDGADVDPALGERLERLRGHTCVAAHPDADHRDLCDVVRAVEAFEADRFLEFREYPLGPLEIRGRHRERKMAGGAACCRVSRRLCTGWRPPWSLMGALRWALSVWVGTCQPCHDRAVTPIDCSTMARSPAATCSPEATTASYSRASCNVAAERHHSTSWLVTPAKAETTTAT